MAFNLMQILSLLQNGGNPMGVIQQLAGNDPNLQMAMQMAQTGDPKQVFLNLAKERGMTPEQIQQFVSQAGFQM